MTGKNYFSEAAIGEKPSKRIGLRLNNGSITTDKLADKSVTTKKLADGCVTEDKLDDDVKGKIDNSLIDLSLGYEYSEASDYTGYKNIYLTISGYRNNLSEFHSNQLTLPWATDTCEGFMSPDDKKALANHATEIANLWKIVNDMQMPEYNILTNPEIDAITDGDIEGGSWFDILTNPEIDKITDGTLDGGGDIEIGGKCNCHSLSLDEINSLN